MPTLSLKRLRELRETLGITEWYGSRFSISQTVSTWHSHQYTNFYSSL